MKTLCYWLPGCEGTSCPWNDQQLMNVLHLIQNYN